jgi:ribosomal protein S18 acetylase RimI-like enzyme
MDSLTARYAICGPGDVDELVALLARVFTADDPPAVAAGLTPREFEALVELYRTRAATGGLTVVAREASTGEMIGVLLAEDSASPFPEGVERLSPKFAPIFDILGELDSEYRRGRFPMPGESLHLFLLGVSRAFARRKIAQGLVEHCLVVGRRRGYRRAVTEATNTVSQHISASPIASAARTPTTASKASPSSPRSRATAARCFWTSRWTSEPVNQ